MLAFLSHDLRSPLASLIAASDLARIKPEYRDSDSFIRSIKNSAGRALQMADDFLAMIRAESISPESFEPVNLTRVMVDSVKGVESQASNKHITLGDSINQDQSIYILGDRSMLERMIINLLTNALKYTPMSGTVDVGLIENHNEAHCWIKDTGYGINESDQEKIFRRFERIKHEGGVEEVGIGLGLAFVRLSVERHHGRIELESIVGEGSCFHIYLPRFQDNPDSPKRLYAADGLTRQRDLG